MMMMMKILGSKIKKNCRKRNATFCTMKNSLVTSQVTFMFDRNYRQTTV